MAATRRRVAPCRSAATRDLAPRHPRTLPPRVPPLRVLALRVLALRVLALRVLALLVPATMTLLAGCAGGAGGGAGGEPAGGDHRASGGPGIPCGVGNGRKAAGAPIKIGAIATHHAGVRLSESTDMTAAYFACVNENGGVHGRPIQFVVLKDGLDPQQTAAQAARLLDSERVDALVGSFSVLDCAVNGPLYARRGLSVVDVGSSMECFRSPNLAPVNAGPSYSALATARYLLSQRVRSVVMFTSSTPGAEAINQSVIELGRQAGVPVHTSIVSLPTNDPTSVALQAVRQAGAGGGVIINLDPGNAIKVFTAAEQQGLVDRVRWSCPALCNDASFARQLGTAWNGKLAVNAEINLIDSAGPDNRLFLQVRQRYAPHAPINTFGQLGFLAARIATQAMLDAPAEQVRTSAGVNAALKGVRRFSSDLYCKPWYFGDQSFHLADNTTRMVTPRKGVFVQSEDCAPIPALPNNDLASIRAYEKQIGIG